MNRHLVTRAATSMLSPLIRARPTLNGGRARSSRDLSITVLSDMLSQTGRAALLRLPRGSRKLHGLDIHCTTGRVAPNVVDKQLRSWNSLGAGSCQAEIRYIGTCASTISAPPTTSKQDRASIVQLRFWHQSRRPQHRDILISPASRTEAHRLQKLTMFGNLD
jgi:hypothetical protein